MNPLLPPFLPFEALATLSPSTLLSVIGDHFDI
jgi:hypothetical protein